MAKKKSKSSEKVGLLRSVLNWLFAPMRKSAFADEDRFSKKPRRKPSPAKSRATHKSAKSSRPKEHDDQSRWIGIASVDKRGNVRFEGKSDVLFQSNKGSKTAALDEAKTHFDAQVVELEQYERLLSQEDYDRDAIANFVTQFRKTPGLAPSSKTLDEVFDRVEALNARLNQALEANRKARMSVISSLESSRSAGFTAMKKALATVGPIWEEAGEIEPVHLASLSKRLDNAKSAISKELQHASDEPLSVMEKRSELLDAYAELMAEEAGPENLEKALQNLSTMWAATTDLNEVSDLSLADLERYTGQTSQREEAEAALQKLATVRRQDIQDIATVSRVFLSNLIGQLETAPDASRKRLSEIDEQVRNAIAGIRPAANSDDSTQILRAQSLLNAAYQAHEMKAQNNAKRTSEAALEAVDLKSHLEALQPNLSVSRSWSYFDEQKAELVDKLGTLRPLLGRTDREGLDSFLREFIGHWAQVRAEFFGKLDAGREASEAKKVNLIDRLTHYPEGLTAKEIEDLLKSSLEEWKGIGPAERTREEELWAEFSEVRKSIGQELQSLREEAKGERLESMSAAFVRKRERMVWLEWLANHDRYLAQQKDHPTLAKDWAAKEREIAKLQGQLLDIQRKLNRASSLRAKLAQKSE